MRNGNVTFIESINNQTDPYRIIKEQYEKLFVKYEPEYAYQMTVASNSATIAGKRK